MKYTKELHDRVRQNLRMFDYPRFDDGDIDALLDEIDRLQSLNRWHKYPDEKPEHPNWVLAEDELHNVFPATFMNGNWYDDVQDEIFLPYRVTKWRELPQPEEQE